MNKKFKNTTDALFVISAWNNNIDWVHNYTDYYIVYDKSNTLEQDDHIFKCEDVGFNIFDTLHFIVCNYNNLPDLIIFMQGHPWDHISENKFNKLVNNTEFTALEDYDHIPESDAHKKDEFGNYLEINSSWYLYNEDPKFSHKYYWTFDQFMEDTFENYIPLDWIRFAPGAQYIVPKENILYYSKEFYQKLMGTVGYSELPLEGYLLERAMWYVFTNTYKERPIKKYE